MSKRDKRAPTNTQIATDASVAAISAYVTARNPLLGGIIDVAGSLFNSALARRASRIEQLADYIVADETVFTDKKLADPQFQDGVVYLIEKYIRERNDAKLVIMRNILNGFAMSTSFSDFPLEELLDLVSRVRFNDIELFRRILIQARQQQELQTSMKNHSFKVMVNPYNVSRLIYFGLLQEDRTKNGATIREAGDTGFLFVWVSALGWQFESYVKDSKE